MHYSSALEPRFTRTFKDKDKRLVLLSLSLKRYLPFVKKPTEDSWRW